MKKKILILGAVAFMLASCGKSSSVNTGDSSNTTPTGGSEPTDTTPAHEHSWGEWSVTTSATCTTAGEETRTCSGCGETETRPIDPTGVHTPSDTWSSDADNHWKTCTDCGCELEKAAHDFVEKSKTLREDKSCYDVVYECSVCGYTYTDTAEYTLTQADILEKLAAAKTKSENKDSAVKSYEYSYFTGYGNPTTGTYEYGSYNGKDAFKQTSAGVTSYGYYDGSAMCGYKVDDTTGAVSKFGYSGVTANDFKGVNFTMGFYNPNYTSGIYGIDPIFTNVYGAIAENSNKDLKLTYADGVYGYELGVVFKTSYGSTNYYTLKGTISFDAATGAVKDYYSEYAQYFATEIVPDEELGTFEVAEGKTKTPNKFSYNAAIADRGTIDVPYSYDDFKFQSFGFSYNGTPIAAGSTIEAELTSTSIAITLSSRTPAIASPEFDEFTYSVVDSETGATVPSYPYYSAQTGMISGIPAAVGKTYNVTISTKSGISFSFSVKGKAPSPTYISMSTCTINDSGVVMTGGDVPSKVYIGMPINITANVQPYTADKGFTLTCKNAAGEVITLPKSSGKDYSNNTVEYYLFDMTVAGTYTLEIKSTAKESISQTKTVEVAEAPSMDSVFTGNYYYINKRGSGEVYAKFAFAPDTTTEATDGTVTVTNYPGKANQKIGVYSYTLNAAGNGIDCTLVSGESDYCTLRFVVTSSYSINACFRYATDGVDSYEQTLSLDAESDVSQYL